MPRLKYVEPDLVLPGSVALVGSSNCLLNTEYGNQIDQYNDVIRFNRSPMEGYEQYVGKKCTLRVVNIHVFSNIDVTKEGYSHQPRFFVKNLRNCNIMCMGNAKNIKSRKKENTHESTSLFVFNWKDLVSLKMNFGYQVKCDPTIGLIMIFVCISSGIRPDLYGFHDSDGTWGHYWEKRPPAGPCHNIKQEKELIKRLEREGRIRLFK